MSDDDGGADIVELYSTADQAEHNAPLRQRKRDPARSRCLHKRVELERANRRAYCCACGDELDCFEVLSGVAGNWQDHVNAWKHANREATAARARLAEMKRQENNAKSRLGRLQDQTNQALDKRTASEIEAAAKQLGYFTCVQGHNGKWYVETRRITGPYRARLIDAMLVIVDRLPGRGDLP